MVTLIILINYTYYACLIAFTWANSPYPLLSDYYIVQLYLSLEFLQLFFFSAHPHPLLLLLFFLTRWSEADLFILFYLIIT